MKKLKELLTAYLENRASEQQKEELAKSLENPAREGELSELLQEIWDNAEPTAHHSADKDLLERIKQRMGSKPEQPGKLFHLGRRPLSYAVAACITALFLLGGWWLFSEIHLHPASYTYEVRAGEEARRFELPDGSSVWLNADSRISFEKKFIKKRVVHLSGEGFFQVAGGLRSPFRVEFGDGELVVVGTEFNVKAYANEPGSKIHVKEGRVDVSSNGKTARLAANDHLVVNLSTASLLRSHAEFGSAAAWKERQLVFQEVPLDEILRSIERHYNVEVIQVRESRNPAKQLTVRYPAGTPLQEVMEGLAYWQDLSYRFISTTKLEVTY